jgi:hypothetical protein
MFTILFALLLALRPPASMPSHTTTAPKVAPPTAAATTNNCYCQTIPLKDWGK